MNDHQPPQTRDLVSVGTRVNWGAISAGCLLALALCLLMNTLAIAVGLSVHEQVAVSNWHTGKYAWAFLSAFTALFIGGMATSLLTVGESKTEGVIHGILMWALLLMILLLLGSAGVKNGLLVMTPAHTGTIAGTSDRPESKTMEMSERDVKHLAWITFASTWLSMLAAAAGAFVGAGPTFRVSSISLTRVSAPNHA